MNATPVKVSPVSGHSTLTSDEASPQTLVLVVDDHADTRDLLRYVFESRGCHVIEATDGEAAVYLAESAQPDIILMDSTLKHVDGIEATRRIRNIPTVSSVPIVFLSGHAQATARAAAMASGANDYLVKPVSLDLLELCVARQLKDSGRIERKELRQWCE